MIAPLEGGQGGAGAGGGGGGWLVLRKHLLQWLLAVSARCGDVRASSEYFAGLAELTAALEEERSKADREFVCQPFYFRFVVPCFVRHELIYTCMYEVLLFCSRGLSSSFKVPCCPSTQRPQ